VNDDTYEFLMWFFGEAEADRLRLVWSARDEAAEKVAQEMVRIRRRARSRATAGTRPGAWKPPR
jgi:hypothetical protein